MKKLCCDDDAELCRSLMVRLEERGIPCLLKDNAEPSLFGADPSAARAAAKEVWILNDGQFDEAWALLNASPPALAEPCADGEAT